MNRLTSIATAPALTAWICAYSKSSAGNYLPKQAGVLADCIALPFLPCAWKKAAPLMMDFPTGGDIWSASISGATTLYINGAHSIKPSKAAGETPVVTALIFKSK